MSTLFKKVKARLLQARQKSEKEVSGPLSALISEVSLKAKNELREPNDTDVIEKLTKFRNDVVDNMTHFEEGSPEFIKLSKEVELYNGFLPEMLTHDQIVFNIGICLGGNINANMGEVMKYFKHHFPGQYDGKELSSTVGFILKLAKG